MVLFLHKDAFIQAYKLDGHILPMPIPAFSLLPLPLVSFGPLDSFYSTFISLVLSWFYVFT